jgi:hypothetical protein
MKSFIVGTISALFITIGAFAQGTISFKNLNSSPAINAPVFLSDGTTKLSGSRYLAGLMAGTTANNLTQVAGVATPFLTGGAAGYFSGGVVTLPGIPGGIPAFVQVIFWDTAAGATFPAAQASAQDNAWGQSPAFMITPGDPNATPPQTPAFLVGLVSSTMVLSIPEPSVWSLLSCGVLAMLLFRCRNVRA